MTKVSATEAARQFSELMNRVKYQGQSFEVTRGNETVARIVPAGPSSPVSVAELNDFFTVLPPLDSDDVSAFEHDIDEIRSAAGSVEKSDWE